MPKIVDHDQRRTDLVAAACAVVASEGIEAATMRRIATEAGCTTGRITHYFNDKHEVLVAALRQVHTATTERMVERLAEAPPDRRLREVLAEALPLDEPRRAEWRVWLAFWGQAADDEELQREQRDRYREWADLLGDLLDLAPDDPSVDRLIAAVDGIGIRATLDPDTFPPARQLRGLDAFLPDNR